MRSVIQTRICIICLLAGFLGSVTQTAAGFSFSISNKDSNKNNPPITSNRPWGNIGAYKPGLKTERSFTGSNGNYNYSYSYSYSTAPGTSYSTAPGTSYNTAPGTSYNTAPGAAPADSMTGNYYLGSAPGTGWPAAMAQTGQMNSRVPFTPQMQAGMGTGEPRVEVEVSESSPYEQQNIIYTVRVVSNGNLKTLNHVLPRIDGAVLEKVDGPVASARRHKSNGGQEIVNAYRFKLTPLRSGEIVIPAIRFTGTHASANQWNRPGMQNTATGESFTIASRTPLMLDVQPAHPGVKPWLPLHGLKLQARMSHEQRVKEGTPVTLTLVLSAKGAVGEQLPSLEQQLKSSDFRVYRESTSVKNGISRDGLHLTGSRMETYTLIPLKDGWIRLPDIAVDWWDVRSDTAMLAGIGDQGVAMIDRGNNLLSQGTSSGDEVFSGFFWYPLMITLGLILGYWLGAWGRTKSLLNSAGTSTKALLGTVKQQATGHVLAIRERIDPSVYLNSLRMGLAHIMPTNVKLWLCTRCVEQEESPAEWCLQFKKRICRHLKIATHTPLMDVAERIIEANPQAEPATVRALAHSLDGAIYGGQPLDFPAWKQDFRNQLRPRLYRRHRRRPVRLKATLPELNPHSAA